MLKVLFNLLLTQLSTSLKDKIKTRLLNILLFAKLFFPNHSCRAFSLQRLQVAYNDALRIKMKKRLRWCSTSEMFIGVGVNTLQVNLQYLIYGYEISYCYLICNLYI